MRRPFFVEAPSGFGPENRGFAVRCLTTWLWRQKNGAGNEIRTRYLHLGKVALCQMSYAREASVIIADRKKMSRPFFIFRQITAAKNHGLPAGCGGSFQTGRTPWPPGTSAAAAASLPTAGGGQWALEKAYLQKNFTQMLKTL